MAETITLVGMMGSGKTTVGRALAARRGWAFFDSDAQVEARAGRTVAQIWREQGEQGFRHLESEALADALAAPAPHVIAAAGGVVLNPANRALLAGHPPVVWLRADPANLVARVATGSHRPLLDADPAGTLALLDQARRPYYAEVASLVVDVDALSPQQVVERIEAALGGG